MKESRADWDCAAPSAPPLGGQQQLRMDLHAPPSSDTAQPDRLILVAQAHEGVAVHESGVPEPDGAFIDARFSTLAWKQLEEAFQGILHILKELPGVGGPAIGMRVGALRRGGYLYPAARYFAHHEADDDGAPPLADGLQPVLTLLQAETLWQEVLLIGDSSVEVNQAALTIARGARDLLGTALPCAVQLLAGVGRPLLLGRKLAPQRVPPETVEYEIMMVRPDGYHWSLRVWHVLDRNARHLNIEFDEAKHLEAIQAVSSAERPWVRARVKVVSVEGKVTGRRLESFHVIGPGLPLADAPGSDRSTEVP